MMKKTLILKKIDYLFLYTLLFFACFVVFSYFIKNRILCFVVSFLVGFLIYLGITFLLSKRSSLVVAKKQDCQNIENLRKTLISNGTIFALEYLKDALNGNITTYGIESEQDVYYVDLSKPELTLCDINRIRCSIFDLSKKKYIIADKASNELKDFINALDTKITFLSFSDLYFLYIKGKKELPKLLVKQKNPTKNTLKSLVKIAFSKNKAKGYFVNGILIFLFSFLYPFKNYYMVFSLVLFVFTILCIFEPFKNY